MNTPLEVEAEIDATLRIPVRHYIEYGGRQDVGQRKERGERGDGNDEYRLPARKVEHSGFLFFPTVSSATTLTSSQIQSVLGLLTAFGADATTIAYVQASLNGTATIPASASTKAGIPSVSGMHSTYCHMTTAGDFKAFQAKYGISQTGSVGPITRAKLNALYSCDVDPIEPTIQSNAGTTTPTTTVAPVTLPSSAPTTSPASVTNPADPSQGVRAGTCLYPVAPVGCYYVPRADYIPGQNCNMTLSCNANPVRGATTTPPTISSLIPSSGKVGDRITATGSGFTLAGNRLKFGTLGVEDSTLYSNLNATDGSVITFTVPVNNYMSCWSDTAKVRCTTPVKLTQPGTYQVSIINENGVSNSMQFAVTGSASSTAY